MQRKFLLVALLGAVACSDGAGPTESIAPQTSVAVDAPSITMANGDVMTLSTVGKIKVITQSRGASILSETRLLPNGDVVIQNFSGKNPGVVRVAQSDGITTNQMAEWVDDGECCGRMRWTVAGKLATTSALALAVGVNCFTPAGLATVGIACTGASIALAGATVDYLQAVDDLADCIVEKKCDEGPETLALTMLEKRKALV